MTYLQDFIHALKGIATPFACMFLGAMMSGVNTTFAGFHTALVGAILFLSGMAWVVYLSFFSRD